MIPKDVYVHQLLSSAVLRLSKRRLRLETFSSRETGQAVTVAGDDENGETPFPAEIALHVKHGFQFEDLCVETLECILK